MSIEAEGHSWMLGGELPASRTERTDMSKIKFTPEMVEAANQKVEKLQRDLDITNADHITLWIEANTILDEPMNQCVSWLACRIVEAYKRAIATRPAANVEAEPVAWLYEQRNRWPKTPDVAYYTSRERLPNRRQNGWTETPLYPASALEQVRKDAFNAGIEKAAEMADNHCITADNDVEEAYCQAAIDIAASIRTLALKDQANV